MTKSSVGVIGYGRFGKLWTDILLTHFDKIAVTDTSDIHPIHYNIQVQDYKNIGKNNTLFLCVPISNLQTTLQTIKPYLDSQTLVCDTCSVKVHPAAWMKELLPKQALLATHPLFGPDSYQKNKSNYNKIVVHPVNVTDTRYHQWLDIFTQMNLRPIKMTPEEHDKQSAYSQGLTHLVGRILNKVGLRETEVSTKGYETLCEIVAQTCLDSHQLFKDLQYHNSFSNEVHQKLQKALAEVLAENTQ